MITTIIETSVQWKRRIQNPFQHLRWSFFRKKVDGLQALRVFTESSVSDASQGSKEASEW